MAFDLEQLQAIPDPFDAPDQAAFASRPPPVFSAHPVRPRTGATPLFSVAIVVLGVLLTWAIKAGIANRPGLDAAAFYTFTAGAFGVPACGAILGLSAFRGHGRVGLGWSWSRLIVALAVAVGLFVVSSLVSWEEPLRAFTLRSTVECAVTTSGLAALPFGAGIWMFRGSLAGATWLRGALFGVACGLVGAVVIRMHCARDSVPHILIGHGVTMALFGFLGSGLGRRCMLV